jgi:hypothetical protein
MKLIKDKIKALEKFQRERNKIILQTFSENEELLVTMNQSQIYEKGITNKGTKIKREGAPYDVYSLKYTTKKRRLGKYQGWIDLHLSGQYLKSYKIIVDDEKVTFTSERIENGFNLSDYIREKYKNVEGLTDENIKKFVDKYVNKALIEYLNKTL